MHKKQNKKSIKIIKVNNIKVLLVGLGTFADVSLIYANILGSESATLNIEIMNEKIDTTTH